MPTEPPPSGSPTTRSPWAWVPSLYFAEGIPYVMVMTVSVILYKRLGIGNADIALYTSWLYLPWVVKPLWSPFVDLFRTKRFWIVLMQLTIGAALASVAFLIPVPGFFRWTLAVFWLMAFASATHDIAADGFYMLALAEHEQSAFIGVRSTLYRIAMLASQGALVMLAGLLERVSGRGVPFAWSVTFGVVAAVFLSLFLYHRFVLPYPVSDRPVRSGGSRRVLAEFLRVFALFFRRKGIAATLAFLLLYRFAEAQLGKLASPFLLDTRAKGGLGLSTSAVGFTYGTVGILALIAGGLLGGYAISRRGLRYWLWPMVLAIQLPDLVYVYLSQARPDSLLVVNAMVAIEQFGYGLGFTAYVSYMIYVSQGEHGTAHYAICTGLMALGMMLPGMASGALQEWLGYPKFFLWVMIATIPGFVAAAFVRIPPDFGRKRDVRN